MKYRNKPTTWNGRRFASQREANRYGELLLLEKNGEVRNIRLQVSYTLKVNGKHICRYIADYVYEELAHKLMETGERKWREVVEDVKGFKTPIYRLKKKLMLAVHGIEIREA